MRHPGRTCLRRKILDFLPVERSAELRAFIARTHGSSHPLTQQAVLEYFFLDSGGRTLTLSCLEIDGALRGVLGYLPSVFLWDFNRVDGVWTSVWFVEKEFRHGGGGLLLRRMMERFSIVAGHGASEDNQAMVGRLGHSFFSYIPKFVYVPLSFSFEGHRVRDTARVFALKHVQSTCQPKTHLEEGYSPRWDAYEELRYSTLRDAMYLHKKYHSNPFLRYHIFTTGNLETPSVGVVRILQIQGLITSCRVLEIFGPSGAEFQNQNYQLAESLLSFAIDQGCSYVECHTNSEIFGEVFSTLGFARDDLGLLPSLVSPVSRYRTGQNFELWASSLVGAAADTANKFYLTRGDGDQERPGIATLEDTDATR